MIQYERNGNRTDKKQGLFPAGNSPYRFYRHDKITVFRRFVESALSILRYSGDFLCETFGGRSKPEYLTRVRIYPIFNSLYLFIGIFGYICAFRYPPPNIAVYTFICAALARSVRVAIIDGRSSAAIQSANSEPLSIVMLLNILRKRFPCLRSSLSR